MEIAWNPKMPLLWIASFQFVCTAQPTLLKWKTVRSTFAELFDNDEQYLKNVSEFACNFNGETLFIACPRSLMLRFWIHIESASVYARAPGTWLILETTFSAQFRLWTQSQRSKCENVQNVPAPNEQDIRSYVCSSLPPPILELLYCWCSCCSSYTNAHNQIKILFGKCWQRSQLIVTFGRYMVGYQ